MSRNQHDRASYLVHSLSLIFRVNKFIKVNQPHQFFIVLLVGKPILQAKWGFFAFGSISNFILAMLIILTNILITFFTHFIGLLAFFLSACFYNESHLIASNLSLCSTSQIFELPYISSKWPILIGVFETLEFLHPSFLIPPQPPFPNSSLPHNLGWHDNLFYPYGLLSSLYVQENKGAYFHSSIYCQSLSS